MRFYSLEIVDPATGQNIVLQPGGLGFARGAGPLATSLHTSATTANPKLIGTTNPNALNIEIDAPVSVLAVPQGYASIRIWGLGIRTISQAANLNPVGDVFKLITLRGGMSRGLPLANPAQAGLILQGSIFQAYGNWAGTEQTLDMIVTAGPDFANSGIAVSWNWQKGQTLQSALTQMFSQAFPSYTASINVSPNLVAQSNQTGRYDDITSFAQYLQQYTQWLGRKTYGSSYDGVGIIPVGNSIYAFDGVGPTPSKTVALAFQDLIGQPTWLAANRISFSCVMRGDIHIPDRVKFPVGVLPPYALTTPEAAKPGAQAASASTFQGAFQITELHHFGNSRQADAASWNTTYVASALLPPFLVSLRAEINAKPTG